MRNDTHCLLYREPYQDESDDSEEYDLDYICSCKRISYFKKDKNGDSAVSIHHGKCKFPIPIGKRPRMSNPKMSNPRMSAIRLIVTVGLL